MKNCPVCNKGKLISHGGADPECDYCGHHEFKTTYAFQTQLMASKGQYNYLHTFDTPEQIKSKYFRKYHTQIINLFEVEFSPETSNFIKVQKPKNVTLTSRNRKWKTA